MSNGRLVQSLTKPDKFDYPYRQTFIGFLDSVFTLFLILSIVSVPQLLVWVQSFPVTGLKWSSDHNIIYPLPMLLLSWILRTRYITAFASFRHEAVITPSLARVCGWVLILVGISCPFMLEQVVWTCCTSLLFDLYWANRERTRKLE